MRQLIWHNRFYLSRVFLAPDDGTSVSTASASGLNGSGAIPAINVASSTGAAMNGDVDYKALYEAERAEKAKYKTALDKSNSENAEYKRKERDRMTQEEQAQADARARDEELAQLRQEITENKVEKLYLGKGIDEKTYKELMPLYIPYLSREQSVALTEKIVAVLVKQQAVVQEQSNNKSIVAGVVHPGSDTKPDSAGSAAEFVKRMLGNQDNAKLEEQLNKFYKL